MGADNWVLERERTGCMEKRWEGVEGNGVLRQPLLSHQYVEGKVTLWRPFRRLHCGLNEHPRSLGPLIHIEQKLSDRKRRRRFCAVLWRRLIGV